MLTVGSPYSVFYGVSRAVVSAWLTETVGKVGSSMPWGKGIVTAWPAIL